MTGENRPPLQAVLPGYSAGALAGEQQEKETKNMQHSDFCIVVLAPPQAQK